MLKTILIALLPLLLLFGDGPDTSVFKAKTSPRPSGTGTLEKMIASSGSVAVDLDMARLGAKGARTSRLTFAVEQDSFFTVLVFNGELRGSLPSSMNIVAQSEASLPGKLGSSYRQLMIENLPWGGQYEYAVRDSRSGYTFFYIEGQSLGYDAQTRGLTIGDGRLVLSNEYATELGRSGDAGMPVGTITIGATMRPVEVTEYNEGEVVADRLPADAATALTPGPDVVVGDLSGLAQFGSQFGTQVGLAVGTDSCNFGTVDLNWIANPANDHPVIPQNLYRMSGGAAGDRTFEQVGQSSVKHAFTALTNNICNLGCNGVGGSKLGSGCSDPYGAGLNSGPGLGSRAWINPFTGFYPRNDSATPNNWHTDHTHTGPSHRILTEVNDLSTSLNAGATYYAEAQYVTPHEYAWCAANPGQCNMFNNVSYRRYNVTGTASPFTFSPAAATVRQAAAITAWPGATIVQVRPDQADGQAFIAYKVTNPSPGVWHYEYAIYNQNLDRGISSFAVPQAAGVDISNYQFHAPPQHPGWSKDGTVGDAGYSSAAWTQSAAGGMMSFASESFAANQNANAVRWGTLYNIRFDSNSPPATVNAAVGFFKTGGSANVQVQGPVASASAPGTITGRVTTSGGVGIGKAYVALTDGGGVTRYALTNSFGFYSFDNVPTGGASYAMAVTAKRYVFTSQNITPGGSLTTVNFVAQ
jgi:hypothetical protein